MGIVELDDVGKAAKRCAGEFGKVSVEIGLEFVEEHSQFRFKIRHLFCRGNIRGVDDFRSKLSQLFDSTIGDCVSFGAVAEIDLPGDANACSTQAIGTQELGIVAMKFPLAPVRSGIARVNTCQSSEQGSGIGDGAGEWTDCVLAVGDWNDACTTGKADGWLDTNDPIR